jgi:ribosomal protein L29
MKKKEKENLKEMKGVELEKKLIDLRGSVREIRFKTEGAKSKNVKELAKFKKDIARVLTLINAQKQHAK